jgi:elongation factor G
LLKCQGATHASSIISKLKNKFNVEVEITKPRIPYRETIRKPSQGMGKFVKQTGGRGQYGIAMIKIEPLPRGQNYEFKNSIFGGAIPKEYIPSVETGIKKAMAEGVIAGYPVIDLKVELYDGKYHPVDSSNFAFEVAGTLAFKEAAAGADPYILEPIYNVEIFVPEIYLGDTIGEINSRRGRVLGFEPYERGYQKISAQIPLENVYDLIVPLRSITKGRCWINYTFSHYEEAPRDIQNRLIEEYKKSRGSA